MSKLFYTRFIKLHYGRIFPVSLLFDLKRTTIESVGARRWRWIIDW